MQADIAVIAINARQSHCGHAGRTLLANLGALAARATLLEFDLETQPLQVVSRVLEADPRVAGFSVYLWNTRLVRDVLVLLRRVAPRLALVLGGPEIVPGGAADWNGLADALVCGEGETPFRDWCAQALAQPDAPDTRRAAPEVIINRGGENPGTLVLPDAQYSDDDLRRRVVYVESTRGCPHHCLYCTSCGTAWRRLPADRLRASFQSLLNRGLRDFRFLDRTFNADEAHAAAVLDFFLQQKIEGLRLHLELTPARFGQPLRERLAAFPAGVLHLEVGIQTLNDAVARQIGRSESRDDVLDALHVLLSETRAALHADLIFGLPGEDEASFAAGFDHLVGLGISEIQVNRLKGLPGTPLLQLPALADAFSPLPPYEVLRTDRLDFAALTRMQRLAHVWDRLHNRGHFRHTLPLLWQAGDQSPYAAVGALTEEVYGREGQVHALGRGFWTAVLIEAVEQRQAVERTRLAAALRGDGIGPAMPGPAINPSGRAVSRAASRPGSWHR
ncbi:MAG: DUF4080 domain-containing protein [Lentisphaerae bacterium]|jgi:hypothetical protein|nr:DUF4080 domain-containing protein [Lentisphaerota bacterium]